MSRPRRNPDYRLEQVDDEILLYNPGRTNILYCNPTASLIWQLCGGEHSKEEIVTLLEASFPEAKDRIAADVEETLGKLLDFGAIDYLP
jgi:hypothetical protein